MQSVNEAVKKQHTVGTGGSKFFISFCACIQLNPTVACVLLCAWNDIVMLLSGDGTV